MSVRKSPTGRTVGQESLLIGLRNNIEPSFGNELSVYYPEDSSYYSAEQDGTAEDDGNANANHCVDKT